jgi:hypothetical protein
MYRVQVGNFKNPELSNYSPVLKRKRFLSGV